MGGSTEVAVEGILRAKGISYRLIPLIEKAYTVADVIRYSNGAAVPEEICKTIIVKGKKSGKMYAVLLRGKARLDFPAVKRAFGEEMGIADPDEVRAAAGVDPGAVCPFLLNVPLYVDRGVMDLERINCGSGDHRCGLEFATKDLAKGVNYQIMEFAYGGS